jgi:hypothetical protein
VLIGEGGVLLWVFSQEVYIFVAWCETFLNVSGFLLTTKHGYNSEDCWYFEVEVSRV